MRTERLGGLQVRVTGGMDGRGGGEGPVVILLHGFRGAHEIPPLVLDKLGQFLRGISDHS